MSKKKHRSSSRATYGGHYNLDSALNSGLFDRVIGYVRTATKGIWRLVYDDGTVGRATLTCYGFELVTLGYPDLS